MLLIISGGQRIGILKNALNILGEKYLVLKAIIMVRAKNVYYRQMIWTRENDFAKKIILKLPRLMNLDADRIILLMIAFDILEEKFQIQMVIMFVGLLTKLLKSNS